MTLSIVASVGGVVIGLLGLAFSLDVGGRRVDLSEASGSTGHDVAQRPGDARTRYSTSLSVARLRALGPKIGVSLVAALLVGTVTRWPVAALLAGIAAFAVPAILASTQSSRIATRRTEAVAVWTELLRDTLTASAGLAQAIVATAGVAPAELREAVGHLADRIMSGASLDDALQAFSLEVDESSAEQVVSALRLAVSARAQRLVDLLGALAESTREEVAMRLRVEASRASARSGVRSVVWFSCGFVILLTLVAHSYLTPFGSATGQLVLAFVGACYGLGLSMMVRLVQPKAPAPVSGDEGDR